MVTSVVLAQKVELRGGRSCVPLTVSDPAKVDRTGSHSVQLDVRSAWRPRKHSSVPNSVWGNTLSWVLEYSKLELEFIKTQIRSQTEDSREF